MKFILRPRVINANSTDATRKPTTPNVYQAVVPNDPENDRL